MNPILSAWNAAEDTAAISTLLSCCASTRWAAALAAQRPFETEQSLYDAADRVWAGTEEADWLEAFQAHPRIGERKVEHATAQSKQWSSQEQASVARANPELLAELAEGNLQYERLYGFTYIVCATGKSPEELLDLLRRRLSSDRGAELREAAEQQRQIAQIRLRKWLQT